MPNNDARHPLWREVARMNRRGGLRFASHDDHDDDHDHDHDHDTRGDSPDGQ